MSNFSLRVEDFGKIESAEIKPSDLTLFIGDNNSGKSYMMTLFYGLLSKPFHDLFLRYKKLAANRFIPIAEAGLSGKIERRRLGPDEFILLEATVNEVLEQGKETFIEQLFNKRIPIGKLAIEFHPPYEVDLCFEAQVFEGKIHLTIETHPKHRRYLWQRSDFHGFADSEDTETFSALLPRALANVLFETSYPIYLPASRTGFLLTYKSVVGDSIEKTFNSVRVDKNAQNSDKLTVPIIDFLKTLGTFSPDKSVFTDSRVPITEFVENRILKGTIEVSKMPVPDYSYKPHELSESLPMHVSSGVVTETTPLWMALQKSETNQLMIEEPEMSLHPALQKEIARALVKIANSHFPIVTSTHSDLILQHVNNMLRLKKHPNREAMISKFGYDEDDLLDSEKVGVYQFDDHNGRATVRKIEYDEERGFAAPTFIDALGAILDETMDVTSEDSAQ